MFITVITDCNSKNDKARQSTRYASLFGVLPTIVGVSSNLGSNATLEASGNLVDTLDAAGNSSGIIVVNVAPRGNKKDGENGNSFCYFYYKNVLVISSIKDYCLSLVKKLNITTNIKILNVGKVLEYAINNQLINAKLKNYIINSQFRSFDFVPRVANWLKDGYKIPYSVKELKPHNDAQNYIWLIDSFGNCKTTLLKNDLKLINGKINTNIGKFKFYKRLKELQLGETAFYIGSSGIRDKRFVEIATQGIPGSAAKTLEIKLGTKIRFL